MQTSACWVIFPFCSSTITSAVRTGQENEQVSFALKFVVGTALILWPRFIAFLPEGMGLFKEVHVQGDGTQLSIGKTMVLQTSYHIRCRISGGSCAPGGGWLCWEAPAPVI